MVAVLCSFLQDSSSLLTHSQPNFFSPTHLSPRGHCQQEEGLGRSARQSVLLACMQAAELTSTAHSNRASEPISQGVPKKETAVALQRIAQLAGLRLAGSDRSFERCCHVTPKGEVRKKKKKKKWKKEVIGRWREKGGGNPWNTLLPV